MNVSSLSPWLLDFHTVRFSVSSGGFFFFLIVVILLLVVGGGTVCLPMPPSWMEVPEMYTLNGSIAWDKNYISVKLLQKKNMQAGPK